MDFEILTQAFAFTQQITEAAGDAVAQAGQAAADAGGAVAEAAEAVKDVAKDAAEAGAAAATETAEAAKEAVAQTQDAAAEVAGEARETVVSAAPEGSIPEVAAPIEEVAHAINPMMIFWIGLGLFGLFVAYFAIEKVVKRRIVGTALTLGVAAFTLFFFLNFPMPKGIDLQGGTQFILEIQSDGEKEIDEQAVQDVMATLQRRLDEGGVTDLTMSPQGTNRILLQMPGISEEERDLIRSKLEETAKLELALVHPNGQSSSAFLVSQAREGKVFPGYELVEPYGTASLERKLEEKKALVALIEAEGDENGLRTRLLAKLDRAIAEAREKISEQAEIVQLRAPIGGELINNAGVSYAPGGFQINVELKGEADGKMRNLTKENVGKRMAILVDREVIMAPSINGVFGANFMITGSFDQHEALTLATKLKNPLQNPIKIESESSVSPAMGEDTIRQGMYAGIAGLAITLLFVLVYYNFAGLVATIGLALNVVIIFGIMSMFQFVMTMPGIAGIILTIGIAIDANVLIYERLREEQKAGKSFKAALDAAYGKAFSAIFDANITTLIAAAILLWFATGTIKGFAITLMIGVFGSLFTSLLVTRVCFGWLMDAGILKNISLWQLVKERSIDFLGKRRKAAMISIILVIGAISLLWVKQDSALGVGLRGGDLLTIQSSEDLSVPKIQDALRSVDLGGEPQVQEQKPQGTETVFYTIRVPEKQGDLARDHLREALQMPLEDTSLESVGSNVGNEMLKSSILALALGLVGIMLYVSFRFESMAFALGAIVAVIHDLTITLGLVIFFGHEINLITVGALLTIAGYSINDTIVVFDRLREGLRTKRGDIKDVMNFCLNATLSRTILTSITTLIVVGTLFVFGGPSLNDFALTLIIGVLIGTYSSLFVASPIVLWWARTRKLNLRREVMDAEAAKVAGPATA
tara:strand:- start:4506 stop:7295 length:2790 start_codon:yes stop_codon:yes gene_type:complete